MFLGAGGFREGLLEGEAYNLSLAIESFFSKLLLFILLKEWSKCKCSSTAMPP